MLIEGIVKSSLIDFPKTLSCILFTSICNFDCFYCHNRDLIKGSGSIISEDEIFSFLKKRQGLLDGVVITGGEPTLQKDLIPFMSKIKALGYMIKLDTNGSKPEVVKNVLEENLCDYFAVDYKAPQDRYFEICSFPGTKVLETINILLESNVDFEARTTVVPQLTLEDLITMAKELPKLPKYVLNKYVKPKKFLEKDMERINAKPYSPDEIKEMANVLRKYQPYVIT